MPAGCMLPVVQPPLRAPARAVLSCRAGRAVLSCISPAARAQIFDKWEDDSDSLVASCQLPLSDLAALAAVDSPGAADCAAAGRAFLLPLRLEPGSGEARARERDGGGGPARAAPLLQVRVTYSAVGCYAAADAPPLGGAGDTDEGASIGGSDAEAEGGASPAAGGAAERLGGLGGGGGVEAAPSTAPPAASPGAQGAARPGGRSAASPSRGPEAAALAASSMRSPAAQPAAPLQAELCFEVIRACGLQVITIPDPAPSRIQHGRTPQIEWMSTFYSLINGCGCKPCTSAGA